MAWTLCAEAHLRQARFPQIDEVVRILYGSARGGHLRGLIGGGVLGQPEISAAASSTVGRIGITRSRPITERIRRIWSLEAATERRSDPSSGCWASRESSRAR